MKKLIISAAIALLAAVPHAFAQNDDHRGQADQPSHAAPAAPAPGGRAGADHAGAAHAPAAGRAGSDHAAAATQPTQAVQPPKAMGRRGADRGNRGTSNNAAQPPPHSGMRGGINNANRGAPNNGTRGGVNKANRGASRGNGTRPNYAQFHRNFTAPRRFQAGIYRHPPGFYQHRWVFGEFLPSVFWARDYWLDDYVDFGLIPPPLGTVWVRYGNDALLIDEYSGEVIQVEYNVFF